jgi:two-component system, OmpR family, phosphate regulon response regulator OmpR
MSNAPHLLLVDDDRRIRELLAGYLSENGYRVTAAATAKEARERMRGLIFDLAVLDVMMPGETGIEFTEALRAENHALPVLFLSALADADDRIAGLTAGGDDYLSKPFEPLELLLRIKNLLRRGGGAGGPPEDVKFGAFSFNAQRGELRREGEPVKLTTREKDFLRVLARTPGVPVNRADLGQLGADDGERSVDVQINRLRQKIEADPANPVHLQTVRGAGYVLHTDAA